MIRWNRFALGVMVLWAGMAVLGPLLPLSPNQMDLDRMMQGPMATQWLGYDDLGRSIIQRLVAGSAISFFVALIVVSISLSVGTLIGTFSAYRGGSVDAVLVRVFDVFLAFPGILLVIALAGLLGPGLDNLIIAMTSVGWVGYARLARAQVLTLKHRDHVLAAIALGTGPWRIMWRHLVPLISAPMVVEATFGIAAVILAEAGLSFLGLGVQAPDSSWGGMIRDGAQFMLHSSHMVLVPGIMLALVVLSINLLGDQLRDWFDVRSRRSP